MVNMWCAHTLRLTKPMQTVAPDHDGVSENRLPRKYRNDFGAERESRDNENIDLRMPENPKEVHPEYGRAPGLRVKEMAAEIAINEQA